jgi:hypothetical protein
MAYPLSLVGTNFTAGDPTSWDALYPYDGKHLLIDRYAAPASICRSTVLLRRS